MGQPNWVNRTIWTGDNLHILRGMNSDCVDLIYLDPPFNSNRNYAAPIGSKAAGAAFKDTWYLSDLDVAWMGLIADTEPALYQVVHAAGLAHGKGMQSYLCMMAVRLIEMKRILKETGSIYLHCDPTASHYLKTLMDAIFGARRYCNDICWLRNPSHPDSKSFGNVADQILFYGGPINKDSIRMPLSQEAIKAHYRFEDDRGLYRPENLKTTGLQGGGYVYDFYGHTGPWRCPESTMMEWERDGRIHLPAKDGGVPQRKRYLHEHPGVVPASVWTDIKKGRGREHVGYPTQKPLALLSRIIKASSNEGDVVLDPFCGCATACVAAETHGREWAGIDLSEKAVELVTHRLRDHHGLFGTIIPRTDIPKQEDVLDVIDIKRERKHILFGEQEGYCKGCKCSFEFRHFEIDHIVPTSKGGPDHIENLQLLCGHCNKIKGDRPMEYLIARLNENEYLTTRTAHS